MTSDNEISTGGSNSRAQIQPHTMPTTRPTATPTPSAQAKSTIASDSTNTLVTAATDTPYAVRAVASLTRLSPSRMAISRRGAASGRRIAMAEIASGGATMAPSANAAASGMPGMTLTPTNATTTVVNSTRPTDRSAIGRRYRLRSPGPASPRPRQTAAAAGRW